MTDVHESAIVGKNVELGVGNKIGPYVIIEEGVKIGSHNTIDAGAHICAGVELGNYNHIHMKAIVGHSPQDLSYKGEVNPTRIGNHNVIREFVSIHRGTKPGTATVIGDSNYIMGYCHIAHNCVVGNHVILVNQASLTGHCIVEDKAFLSGMTGLHQFTRVGTLAMLSALSAVNKDIPPYMLCGGRPAVALGINVVGLRRAGIGPEARAEIKQAYKLLYRSGLNVKQAVEKMKKTLKSPEVSHLITFIEESKRGILDASSEAETLKPKK